MTVKCAWCDKLLLGSWIRVGNVWIHAHCLEQVAAATDAYIKQEENCEEIAEQLYAHE